MDIQITFADGTAELRDAESPCLVSPFDVPIKHPSEERWYLYFPDAYRPFSFCTIDVRPLLAARGSRDAYVWRLTGGLGKNEPLTGEWQSARVETVDEQIERLTRERDAERRDKLMMCAEVDEMEAAVRAANGPDWHEEDERPLKMSERIELLETARAAEKAHADAAEKRLADLRTWAEKEAAEWNRILPNVRGGDGGGSAWDQVVARIDGKAEGQ